MVHETVGAQKNNIGDPKSRIDKLGLVEYIVKPDGKYIATEKITTINKLPSGYYDFYYDEEARTLGFRRRETHSDELLQLPIPVFDEILSDISYFWSNEKLFIDHGFAFKRGILLYGEPGCGKSCLTALLSEQIISEYDGLVFSIKNTDDLENYFHMIGDIMRVIEQDRPIFTIVEDLDGLCAYEKHETMLLNLLDGMAQFTHCVYIGCTNYPEKLKERILNRPSRFDRRYHIGKPNAEIRKYYLEQKMAKCCDVGVNIDDLVIKTEGLSLAHMGEVVKSIIIYHKDPFTTIQTLKNMSNFVSSSQFESKQSPGFKK